MKSAINFYFNYMAVTTILTLMTTAKLTYSQSIRHYKTLDKFEILCRMQEELLRSPATDEKELFDNNFKVIIEVLGQKRIDHVCQNLDLYQKVFKDFRYDDINEDNILEVASSEEYNLDLGKELYMFSSKYCN